jgi:hypothetical protein
MILDSLSFLSLFATHFATLYLQLTLVIPPFPLHLFLFRLINSAKTLFGKPIQFLTGRAYLAVTIVYTSTYITANGIMTYSELNEYSPSYTNKLKLGLTSSVNIGLGKLQLSSSSTLLNVYR